MEGFRSGNGVVDGEVVGLFFLEDGGGGVVRGNCKKCL